MSPKVTNIIRYVFGVFVIIFGLNKFIGFLPFPPIEGDGGELMRIYATSGFMKVIGVLEILGGLGLLLNKFVPLSITVLTAIMFNAFLFHALHDMGGIGGSVLGMILSLALVYGYRNNLSNMLSA